MDLPKYKVEDYCYQCGRLIETYPDHIIKQVPVVTSVKVEEPKLDQDGKAMYNDDGSAMVRYATSPASTISYPTSNGFLSGIS